MMARPTSSAPTPPGTPGEDAHGAVDGTRSYALPGPVVRTCHHPGCGAPAHYGENVFVPSDPADERWWCAAHVPDRFWTAKRREEGRRTRTGGNTTSGSPASRRRFRNGQGELL